MMMIEKAIDLAIQWAVFEPNSILTRTKLNLTLTSFLLSLWQRGALMGASANDAFLRQMRRREQPARRARAGPAGGRRSASRPRSRSSSSSCASGARTISSRSAKRRPALPGWRFSNGALLNPTVLRSDPVLNHNFVISLLDSSSTLRLLGSIALSAIFDVALGGFSECSGLEMSLQIEEFREGGNNGRLLKFPDASHLVEHHAQEGRRLRHGAVGLALRLSRKARASAATA